MKRKIPTLNLILVLLSSASFHAIAIEGGVQAPEERWDYSVHLRMGNSSCSGTLLPEGYILTAAHCVVDEKKKVSVDSVGVSNPRSYVGTAKVVFFDPDYIPYSKSQWNLPKNDVALLRLDNPKLSEKFPKAPPLMSSERYVYMLGGQYPYDRTLIIGYGDDGSKNVGNRKLFFGTKLSISPIGDLLQEDRPSLGASRPGDSGSGIYLLSDNKIFLSAVVSQGVVFAEERRKWEQEGEEYKLNVSIDSFVVPSLCKLDVAVSKAIDFDSTACDDVRHYLNILTTADTDSALYLLWSRMLIENSPLVKHEYFKYLSNYNLARSFTKGAKWVPGMGRSGLGDALVDPRRSSFTKEQKESYEAQLSEMAESLVSLGYFKPLEHWSQKWGWARVKRSLDKMSISRKTGWSIRTANKKIIESSKCKYEICLEKFEISDYAPRDKGSWESALNLGNSKGAEKKLDYEFIKNLICSSPSQEEWNEKILSSFEELGVSRNFSSVNVKNNYQTIKIVNNPVKFTADFANGLLVFMEVDSISISNSKADELKKKWLSSGFIDNGSQDDADWMSISLSKLIKSANLKIDIDIYGSNKKNFLLSIRPMKDESSIYNKEIDKIFECH